MSSSEGRERRALLAALQQSAVRLSSHSGFYTDAAAVRLGLNRTDVDCLIILSLEGAATAGRLAEVTGLTTGGISGILDRLERTGFIRRESDPEDRRRVIVRVAPEQGRRLIELFAPAQEAMNALYVRYSDAELAVLLNFSERSLAVMQEQTARLRTEGTEATEAAESGGVFSAPLGDLTRASLEFAGGAHTVRVRGEAGMAELFRARFESDGVKVRVNQGAVTVQRRWRSFTGRPEGEIILNAALPWAIRLRGGSNRITADLTQLAVTEIEVVGGMNDAEVRLGAPAGTASVRVVGGASQLTLSRPAATPVRLYVRGGVRDLELDGEHLGSPSGGTWETASYADALGRYDIAVRGGISRLRIERG